MAYNTVNYRDVDSVGGGLHFLRDALECENLGFSVVECEANWTGKEHDHADSGHEEVYYLVSGEATLHVDGEAVALDPGDAVRVAPESVRQLENGPRESTLVVAGAP